MASPATVKRVQSNSAAAYTGGSNTLSISTLQPVTSGDELIVAVSDYYSADSPYLVSDTLGNVWHLATSFTNGPFTAIFYAENIKGGSKDQITAKASRAGAFPIVTVTEYSGLLSSKSLDGASSNNAAGTSYAGSSVNTTQAGDLVFSVHHTNGSPSALFVPASPWTTVHLQSDGSNHEHQTQDQIAPTAGGYISHGSLPQCLTVQTVTAAFKAAPATPIVPSIPTNLSATAASSSQINLTWTPSTDSVGIFAYLVFRNGLPVGSSITPAYSDSGLAPATTYAYAVQAVDQAGSLSAKSAAVSATTSATGTSGPTIPTGLSATAVSTTQVNLAWTASTDSVAIANYVVYRNGVQIATPGTTTFSDFRLAAATSYSYAVAAVDTAGKTSALSAYVSAKTPAAPSAGPSIPTSLSAVASSYSQINLSWGASTDSSGIASYVVYRNGVSVGKPTGTSYSDTGLTASTTYSYTVAAVDNAGKSSSQSASASATTQPAPATSTTIPSTWNTGHSRLPAPSQAYLTALAANAIEMAKYNAAAATLDPTNPIADMGQFRRALIAYLANKAAGNTALASADLAKFEQLADLGGTWGQLMYSVNDGVGNGSYTLTSASANFLSGCGGQTCANGNYVLSIQGRLYNIASVSANTIVLNAADNAPISGTGLPIRIFNGYQAYTGVRMAMVYDWLYNDLDIADRTAFMNQLESIAELWEEYYNGLDGSPYNDKIYIENGPDGFLAAFAIYPDFDQQNPSGGSCPSKPCGTYHVTWMANKLLNVFVPVWQQVFGQNGGGWSEDWSQYANNNPGLDQWLVPVLLSWQSASGQPYFSQNPWFKNFASWTMYTTRPDFTMEHIGEVAAGTLTPEYNINYDLGVGLGSLNGLAEIYNDPIIRGWARTVNQEFAAGPSGFEPSAWPFYKPDNNSNAVSTRAALPTSKNFDGWGVLFARSGWSENDTDVSLKYGDNFWSHAHADAGAFTISHRGNLAISSGNYRAGSNSEHEIQYGKQSISQNTLLIVDPNDVYPNETFGSIDLNNGSSVAESLANDGGQRRAGTFYNQLFPQYVSPDCLNKSNTPGCVYDWQSEYDYYHMGTLVSYSATPNYTYAAIDITPAYNNPESATTPNSVNRTQRAQSVIRNMLFIPIGTSAYVVVYDEINSTNASFQKKWLLHSINQPLVSGNRYEIDRTENVTQSLNWTEPYANLLSYANGGAGVGASYQYGGKLVGWMLSPNGGTINVVGGPGKEFWIADPANPGAGTNWNGCMEGQCSGQFWGFLDTSSTPDILTPNPLSGPIEPGSWRIEETPSTQEQQDYFLNVMFATDYNNTNVPATVTPLSSSGSIGATWTDGTNTYTVTFPTAGTGGNISITGQVNINQALTSTASTATPPSVPTNLSATANSSSQISLSWSASTDPAGIAGYKMFRNGTQVGTTTTTSYSDTGLQGSTTYAYTVAAFDTNGNNSAQSASVSATTLAVASAGISIQNGTWTMVPTNGFPEAVVGYDNLVYAPGLKKFVMWENYHNVTSESNQSYLAYDFSTNRWDVLGLGGDFNSSSLPGSGHSVGMLQYDPTLNVFINYCCFSGSQQYESSQQVYQFDPVGSTGRNKQTLNRPGNTTEASAVFDTQDNVYVLFDRDRGTWIYNPTANTFTQVNPSGTPPNTVPNSSGYFSGMAYDSANNNVYLFGGSVAGGTYSNDLYTYNVPSNTWTRLSALGTLPSPRQFAGLAYDSKDNIFLMVGGLDATGYLNDTWIYNPATNIWTQMQPAQSPAQTPGSTTYQRLAYDVDDNVFVLVWPGSGGFAAGQPAGYGAVQTWFFRYAGTGNNVGYLGNPAFAPTAASLNRNSDAWGSQPVLASSGTSLYAGWIETGEPLVNDNSLYPHPFVDQLSGSTWIDLGTSYTSLDSEFAGLDEAHDPSLAVIAGVPWLSWNKENSNGNLLPNNLYAKYWNGSAWMGGPVGAVTGGAADTASFSQMTGVGGVPYIAFLETDRSCFPWCNRVFVKQWTGSAWSLVGTGSLNRVSQTASVIPHAAAVSMASDGAHPYVAWTEFAAATSIQSESAPQVYVDEWNGTSWVALGGSLNISSGDSAYDPSIAYVAGQLYVAWTERSVTGNSQVFVAVWNGTAWATASSGTLNRNTNTGWAEAPSLVADPASGSLYLAWTEQQNIGQKVQTYVDQFLNGTWSTLGQSLNADATNGSAERVSLAVVNGQPVAAWGEVKSGSLRNVYLKQWNGSAWINPAP